MCDKETKQEKIEMYVEDAFTRVFNGNERANKGSTDNHCNEQTIKHFMGLYNKDENAIKKEEEIRKRIKSMEIVYDE